MTALPLAAHGPAFLAEPEQTAVPHPNYRFMVSQVTALGGLNAAALDYGCGSGEVVNYARSKGIDMVGADIFYGGNPERRAKAVESGQFGKTIFEMRDGRLPFPDNHFDFVCSNQVFEHVEDIDLALSEIRRVLKPSGTFLNIFPSIGIIREGHCGVPLAHWLNRLPRIQWLWLYLFRLLGFGYRTKGRSCSEWATYFSDYLRRFTVYRTRRDLLRAYARHFGNLKHLEHQFAAYRLNVIGRPKAAKFAASHPRLSRVAIRRLASMVLVARTA